MEARRSRRGGEQPGASRRELLQRGSL